MKTFSFNLICLIMFVSISITSCVDEENSNTDIDEPTYEPVEIITTTVNGIILDENAAPVTNALINIDNAQSAASAMTDENGYYEIFNADVKGRLATVSVAADGMFDSEFKVSVSKNEVSKADFVINTYAYAGTFQSSQKSTISRDNDITLEFPQNSIMTNSGQEYQGEVEVYIGKIDPTKNSITNNNFGGNLGENISIDKGVIYQYQSIQVELKSPSGELLNVKKGNTVKVTIKADNGEPSGLDKNNLSMMYYDEEENIWKEETTGEFIDNNWVAELPHFSTWTWCTWLDDNEDGNGQIQLFDGNRSYLATSYVLIDYGDIEFLVPTSSDGTFHFIFGLKNVPFTLKVWDECEEEVYTQEYSSLPNDGNFGTITIDTPENYSKELSVSVFNCDDTPVAKGFSRFCIDGLDYQRCQIIPIVDGFVKFDFLSCEGGLEGKLFLLNEETLMASDPIKINLNESDVVIDYVALCNEFVNNLTLNINGSLFYSNHQIDYGGTSGGGEKSNNMGSDNEIGGVNFGVEGSFENPGSYDFKFISVKSIDSTIFVFQFEPNMTFELEEFEPNATEPDNFFFYPERLKGSFSGTAEYKDPITNMVLGTYTIDGTVLID